MSTGLQRSSEGGTIEEITAKLESLDVATLASTFDAKGNDLFSSLPPELLGGIFYVLLAADQESTTLAIRRLAGASRRWRDIVLSTPRCWTIITSVDMLSIQLSRSKQLPLDIDIIVGRGGSKGLQTTADVNLLISHSTRWRRLAVTGRLSAIMRLQAGIKRSLQLLEHLQLRVVDENTDSVLQLGPAPQLRSVVVHGLLLSVPLTPFNIKSVNIAHLPKQLATTTHILDMMRSCSALEDLALRDIQGNPRPVETPVETFELPHLKHLVLYNLGSYPLNALLRRISAPTLAAVQYTLDDAAVGTNPTLWESQHLTKLITPILGKTSFSRVSIEITQGKRIRLEYGDVVAVELRRDSVCETLRLIGLALNFKDITNVTLKFHRTSSHDIEYIQHLLALPTYVLNLRTLHIEGFALWEMRVFCRLLGTRPIASEANWPCSGLERFHIHSSAADEDEVRQLAAGLIEVRNPARTRPSVNLSPAGVSARKLQFFFGEDKVFDETLGAFVPKDRPRASRTPIRSGKTDSGTRNLRPRQHR